MFTVFAVPLFVLQTEVETVVMVAKSKAEVGRQGNEVKAAVAVKKTEPPPAGGNIKKMVSIRKQDKILCDVLLINSAMANAQPASRVAELMAQLPATLNFKNRAQPSRLANLSTSVASTSEGVLMVVLVTLPPSSVSTGDAGAGKLSKFIKGLADRDRIGFLVVAQQPPLHFYLVPEGNYSQCILPLLAANSAPPAAAAAGAGAGRRVAWGVLVAGEQV